jgi:ubiquitin carboxyl-terminal hydrolase 14
MRKVTFPMELDATEFCSEDLRKLLIPVRDKIREIRKEIDDDERARKRQKRMKAGEENDQGPVTGGKSEREKKKEEKEAAEKKAKGEDTKMEDVEYKTDAQIEAERATAILAAKKELLALVDSKLTEDVGGSQTGLYELRGVITHQGITADSGHYTSFVKKTGKKDLSTGKVKEEDGKWWWFNDDKVSEVDEERIVSLSGGGEYCPVLYS